VNVRPEGAILVTGASGFLGRHVLEALAREKPRRPLVALARDPEALRAQPWFARDVEIVRGSLTEPGDWIADPRLRGLGGVVHLAAVVRHSRSDPEPQLRTNVEGTLTAVRAAAQHGCRVVFVSTSGTVACFSSAAQIAYEDARFCEHTVARWPYYLSKIRAEQRGRELAMKLGVDLVVLRPPVLLGPGDHRLRSTAHVARLLDGRLPFSIQGGIAFLDVRDAARAVVQALRHPSPAPVYHLPGTNWSVPRFFRAVAELAGQPTPRIVLPGALARALARLLEPARLRWPILQRLPDPVVLEMGSRYWAIGSHHAARDLGHAPRAALETLRDTIAWLEQQRTNGAHAAASHA
jgi:dihydroflavonol-4-reductase